MSTITLVTVTDPASIAAAARQVGERHGKLDVLVNNAAIDYDTWQRAIDADLAVVREAAETGTAPGTDLGRALRPSLTRPPGGEP